LKNLDVNYNPGYNVGNIYLESGYQAYSSIESAKYSTPLSISDVAHLNYPAGSYSIGTTSYLTADIILEKYANTAIERTQTNSKKLCVMLYNEFLFYS